MRTVAGRLVAGNQIGEMMLQVATFGAQIATETGKQPCQFLAKNRHRF